jgi:hypothetical protein
VGIKFEKAVQTIEKATGQKVQVSARTVGDETPETVSRSAWIHLADKGSPSGKGYTLSFSENGRRGSSVICIHTVADGLVADSMTDYFPGQYHATIAAALRSLGWMERLASQKKRLSSFDRGVQLLRETYGAEVKLDTDAQGVRYAAALVGTRLYDRATRKIVLGEVALVLTEEQLPAGLAFKVYGDAGNGVQIRYFNLEYALTDFGAEIVLFKIRQTDLGALTPDGMASNVLSYASTERKALAFSWRAARTRKGRALLAQAMDRLEALQGAGPVSSRVKARQALVAVRGVLAAA